MPSSASRRMWGGKGSSKPCHGGEERLAAQLAFRYAAKCYAPTTRREKSITPTATERRETPLLLQDPNGWPLLLVMHRPPLQELYGGKRDFPPAPRAANHSEARRASRIVTGCASTPGQLPLVGFDARRRRSLPLKQGCVVTSRGTKR